ncbi:hypothetical protein HID58_024428 [Brassica napus]|uniref:Transcription factor TFIIIB component B'' Myb domain-containing protein n=1 Tax=Brassica napus TaxID=3708 RepID=A0ABQ8D4V2_BRANA|nr:hypothetical protein HID58_024428 [Brassica napus]
MDLDFDDQPAAAPAARAGAKFKPKGRPHPKKKHLSLSTSQPTTLSTLLPSEILSTTQSQDPVSLHDVSTIVPDSGGLIDQSTVGTISKENVFSEVLSVLRPCSNVNCEGKRCDNGKEAAPANPPDDPKSLDSAAFVTQETDEVIHSQTQRMQTEEEECHWNMETLNIVQEEGITTAYEQHTGKFQPKPRLQDAVIEEPESHYSVDHTTAANQSKVMVIVTNTVPGGEEHEDHVIGVGNGLGNTVEEEEETRSERESKKGKSKRARKQKTTSEEEPNKSPQKKKFKHSSRQKRNRTLEKELLETPDDEIKFLPIKDMLRLVEYREWLEVRINSLSLHMLSFELCVCLDPHLSFLLIYTEKGSKGSSCCAARPRKGIQDFGGDLSMVQLLFSDRTHQQIKLKFKLEERRNPLKLNDALSTRPKDLTRFHTLIKKLQQEAPAERAGEEEGEAGEEAETTTDVPENEEPAKSEETGDGVAGVKEPDGGDIENNGGDECEDNEGDDDDDEFWNSYKSDM